ncbi:Os05g0309750 [Oryza sativa Japonica Group]|uniref:Os05g0309750 protein n=2 Tax=Oryza sativa subsp. japonica TaxID=39947 RepID=A0A0P0WKR0_ORYSJ|nr:Os05g0309750 [Oryza sativa Japonica Group]
MPPLSSASVATTAASCHRFYHLSAAAGRGLLFSAAGRHELGAGSFAATMGATRYAAVMMREAGSATVMTGVARSIATTTGEAATTTMRLPQGHGQRFWPREGRKLWIELPPALRCR